jgi:hypothetical protein
MDAVRQGDHPCHTEGPQEPVHRRGKGKHVKPKVSFAAAAVLCRAASAGAAATTAAIHETRTVTRSRP